MRPSGTPRGGPINENHPFVRSGHMRRRGARTLCIRPCAAGAFLVRRHAARRRARAVPAPAGARGRFRGGTPPGARARRAVVRGGGRRAVRAGRVAGVRAAAHAGDDRLGAGVLPRKVPRLGALSLVADRHAGARAAAGGSSGRVRRKPVVRGAGRAPDRRRAGWRPAGRHARRPPAARGLGRGGRAARGRADGRADSRGRGGRASGRSSAARLGGMRAAPAGGARLSPAPARPPAPDVRTSRRLLAGHSGRFGPTARNHRCAS